MIRCFTQRMLVSADDIGFAFDGHASTPLVWLRVVEPRADAESCDIFLRGAGRPLYVVRRTAYPIPIIQMTTTPSASRTPLYLTYTLMLFGFSSISSARVAVSLYALSLDASPTAVGLLVGSFYVFPVLLSWPIGRYTDRV